MRNILFEGAMATGKTSMAMLIPEARPDEDIFMLDPDEGCNCVSTPEFLSYSEALMLIGWSAEYLAVDNDTWDTTAILHPRGLISLAVNVYRSTKLTVFEKKSLLTTIRYLICSQKVYDMVFYFPIRDLNMDEWNSNNSWGLDKELQRSIDRTYLTILKNWNIPYIEVRETIYADRINEIYNHIEKHYEV